MNDLESLKAIAEKHNYLNENYKYLNNVQIQEYDLENAGFNIISFLKLLPEKTLNNYKTYNKKDMNIAIGKEQIFNKDLSKYMNEEYQRIRYLFLQQNNIKESQILSIKKDAIFLINTGKINGIVDNFYNFRLKHTYSSFILLKNKEFYYSGYNDSLDVKGLTDESKTHQEEYILRQIKEILKSAEESSKKDLFKRLLKYRTAYIEKTIPIQSYRNLDTDSFDISGEEALTLDDVPDDMKDSINITHNYLNYIVPLISMLL